MRGTYISSVKRLSQRVAGLTPSITVGLILFAIGLTALLAYRAFDASRAQRQVAEHTLRDYAGFAAFQLKTATTERDRMAGLVAQNAAARRDLDQLEAQVESAQVAIATAQDQIALADKAIADATVRSPISGVVIEKKMSAGEYASLMPPTPVVVLQDQSSLELRFKMPERSITALGLKDRVKVTIPDVESIDAAVAAALDASGPTEPAGSPRS